jgi:hypothetical protein
MGQAIKRAFKRLWGASLWFVGFGLMLASSGIDGAYMAKLMPWPWLGYVLNTVSDIGSEVLMYWFGRLRQYPKNTKRYKMASGLLMAEMILTGFAWLFGWRQLLPILTRIEGAQAAAWLAPVFAAFTPVSLVAVGYAQALLAGRIEKEQIEQAETQEQTQATQEVAQSLALSEHGNGHKPHTCDWCGREFASKQAKSAHLRFCEAYQEALSEQSEALEED